MHSVVNAAQSLVLAIRSLLPYLLALNTDGVLCLSGNNQFFDREQSHLIIWWCV